MRKHIIAVHQGTSNLDQDGNGSIQQQPSNTEDSSPSSPNSSPVSSPSSKYSIAELLSKEPKPQQQFQCRLCAESLPTMAELSQHITFAHISKGHPGLLQPLLHQPFLFPH